MLAGFALRVFRLAAQELRGDEAFGFFFQQGSVGQIVRDTIGLREPHPVGSYLLQKAWAGLTGQSEFALRFVSAWFGALAVALLYRLGRTLGLGRGTALLGAGLLALSPYAIWHSQDARMYTISMALTLASTVLLMVALRRGGVARWGAYAAVSWLALQVHYFVVFVLAAQGVFVLLWATRGSQARRRLAGWLAAMAVLALAYLPWLLAAGATLTGYRGNGDSPPFLAGMARALSVFAVGETVPAAQRVLWAALAGALLVVAAVRLWRAPEGEHTNEPASENALTGRWALALLALYLGVPVLATWASAQGRPIFNERYLVAAAPPFYLLMAVAVLGYRERQEEAGRHRVWAVGGAVLAGVVVLGMAASLVAYHVDPDYSKTRWLARAGADAPHAGGWVA